MIILPTTAMKEAPLGIDGIKPSIILIKVTSDSKKLIIIQMPRIPTSIRKLASKAFWPNSYKNSIPITAIITIKTPIFLSKEVIIFKPITAPRISYISAAIIANSYVIHMKYLYFLE